ncbi:MAG: phytoene desaturase family protein [Sphingobacterium hotanense]
MRRKVAIIGSGFSGLSAAAYAAKAGFDVHVYERHDQPGGRARQFSTDEGFVFDMGPSWYWMPDIIDGFFADFGYQTSDFYQLVSLNPQFEMIFSAAIMQIPRDFEDMVELFEAREAGAGLQLRKFMESAKFKYEIGMKEFVNKPSHSWLEFMSPRIAKNSLKLDLLSNFRNYVARYFKSAELRTLMEFPVIFLGASPKDIPALYSLMNYGGYALGTHYPIGGFYQLVRAMCVVAEKQGTTFHFNTQVEEIQVERNRVSALRIDGVFEQFDMVIASSDYHHTETLLPKAYRNYTEDYWKTRTFAPSSLIYYLGIDERIPNLTHHSLFFENELDDHISCIYDDVRWPDKPLFYACCPSKTDSYVAPAGKENLFLLMPLAIDISDPEDKREHYLRAMLKRIEQHTGADDLYSKIIYKRSYCVSDFKRDYHAYGGNAYGLANTLQQTAVWKPKIRNKRLPNLFYTGQLTVPGPGVPPAIISGRIVANEIVKLKNSTI